MAKAPATRASAEPALSEPAPLVGEAVAEPMVPLAEVEVIWDEVELGDMEVVDEDEVVVDDDDEDDELVELLVVDEVLVEDDEEAADDEELALRDMDGECSSPKHAKRAKCALLLTRCSTQRSSPTRTTPGSSTTCRRP